MSELTLVLSLLIAVIVPRLALRYLQPILMPTLQRMCEQTRSPGEPHAADANSGPEFWWRVLNVLAISGSMLLVLTFGYNDGWAVSLNDFLRRTLWLVTMGVFISVGTVASQIWSRIPRTTAARSATAVPVGHAAGAVTPPAVASPQAVAQALPGAAS
ncbi:hypothetical protein [Roseateles amylovorans]|uniref:Potassium-transporting ATPase subunit KdpA n=1 Tax=Roseateles amylovorans TaxID=2978473 RepID=A0ABY6B9C1_9BURK|nr:hypothetical protein [Roseateles amylovorans]UXH80180.1 hypothetical protein N4261_09995 [Roseateles amylovorans]